MEELIVFGHNDLDMLGCMLNIEYKFPTVKKKYFYTNYANINQIVDDIISHMKANGNKHILIVDVSFGDNKEALSRLYEIGKITHIDHHLYPDGFWDDFPEMKVKWDKTKCATLLCNEYFGNTGQNSNLDKLSKLIDVYDIWQDQHPAFDFTQGLNEYFWKHDIYELTQAIVQNNFKLPDDFTEVVDGINQDINMAISSYEERKLIYRSDNITLAFINDWFNQVMIPDMRNGQDFVIGINSYGIIRVRVRQQSVYTDFQLNKLRKALTGTETTGHMHAFTYRMKGTCDFTNLMKHAEFIVEKINEIRSLNK